MSPELQAVLDKLGEFEEEIIAYCRNYGTAHNRQDWESRVRVMRGCVLDDFTEEDT